MSNVLDPSALLSSLPNLLPESSKSLNSPQDALAALVHSVMSTLSFKFVAADDTSPSRSVDSNVLPDGWNSHGPSTYTLRYRHDQSSLEFVIKLSKLSGRTVINAIAAETEKMVTLDVSTDDFSSPSFFPHTIGSGEGQPLVHGFISSNRVSDFVRQYSVKILQNLFPGLRKEGYVEESVDTSTNSSASSQRTEPSRQYPVPGRPGRSTEDPNPSQPFQLPSHILPRNPLEIGRRDLDPIFQSQPNPFQPPSLFPPDSGDGMFVGPDHPLFGGARRDRNGLPRGPWGGNGFLPPMGAPPGARFDPIGPWPGAGPGRQPPRGPPGFGGPDNDEFMPPGSGDMFS